MREVDFLPEWYKESKRRRLHIHRQYVVLTVVFLAMLTYNLTSEHRIATASARMSYLDEQRVAAESVMAEFNQISTMLGQQKARADVIQQVDSRIDVAAVLAEISHIINDHVILNRVEFASDPVPTTSKKSSKNSGGSSVRVAGRSNKATADTPVGDVRFQVVLAGVAADPADVSTLLGKLEESPYFQMVTPSFSKPGRLSIAAGAAEGSQPNGMPVAAGRSGEMFQVQDFEISCYLANFEEITD